MQRLTSSAGTGPTSSAAAEALAARLYLYENFHEDLLQKRQTLAEELEALRAAGKKNTTRFKEKLGEKLMVSNTLLLLNLHGLE